jgi:hypothetical protein
MRFASSFLVTFLKRVNKFDLLNLYIVSSFRFQLMSDLFIQSVSGEIVNIIGGGSMEYSE